MNPPIHPKLLAFAEAVAAAENAAIPHQQSQVFGESGPSMAAHRARAAWIAAKCPIYDVAPRTCWECRHAEGALCRLIEDAPPGMPRSDAPPCPGFEAKAP